MYIEDKTPICKGVYMSSTPETPKSQLPIDLLSGIVSKIEDLVQIAIECENKPTREGAPLVQIMNRILEVQQQMQALNETSREFLKNIGLTEETKLTEEMIKKMPPEERQLVERLGKLTQVCELEREKMYRLVKSDNRTLKQITEELEGNVTKTRRKSRFKSIGGKDHWIPS